MKKSSGRKQRRALIRENVHTAGDEKAAFNKAIQKRIALNKTWEKNKGRRNLIADKRKQLQS